MWLESVKNDLMSSVFVNDCTSEKNLHCSAYTYVRLDQYLLSRVYRIRFEAFGAERGGEETFGG